MKYQHRSAAFILGLVLLASTTHAAEPAGTTLSLREAIDATLQANPQLAVYRFREQALAGQRTSAGLRPPLQINGGLEDVLGSGDLSTFEGAELTLSLSQVVELGGQRDARVGVASRRADLLGAEQRIAELDLLAEVTRRYIAVAAAQEQVTLESRATALAQQTLDALQPLVTAGQTPASEQARATAALERARLAEGHAQAALDAAKVDLASMWAAQPDFALVTADLLQVGDAGVLSDLLIDLDMNPDLLLFASEERLLDAQLQEAQSEQRGTVQVSAGIRHLRTNNDTGFIFGASMPLGTRERAAGAIATAQANRQEVAARRAIALNRMRAQLTGLHLQLAHAVLEVNTLRTAVLPELDDAQQQTRAAYLGGRYTYLELVSAQQEYLDAERALIAAATDAHLLRAEIERLSGAVLPPIQEPIP